MTNDYVGISMKIRNQGVTGSQIKVTVKNGENHTYLVDNGAYQEGNKSQFPEENYSDVDGVFLTHAHIDHSGGLAEFTGKKSVPVYMTAPTAELISPMLNDMYNVLSMNGRPFDKRDEENLKKLERNIKEVSLYERLGFPNTDVMFIDNPHMLGAAMVSIKAKDKFRDLHLMCTGDYRIEHPFIRTKGIEKFIRRNPIDVLVVETTYGNREHQSFDEALEDLEKIIIEGNKKGDILLASFSIDRTPVLLYMITQLQAYNKKIAKIPVYLDGGLAIKGLAIYKDYDYRYKCCWNDIIPHNFQIVGGKKERDYICKDPTKKIIISTSGQFHGGSITAYVSRMLPDPNCTIVSSGYVAHPMGKSIIGASIGDEISYFGRRLKVAANVIRLNGISAHADKNQLADFIGKCRKENENLKVILTHGDIEAKIAFKDMISGREIIDRENVYIQLQSQHFEINKHTLASGKILIED